MTYLALCGGVGGAKLAAGLSALLPPQDLKIAVNVGDDFEHLSLYVCPDIDTVLYTLAGCANPEQGWGRAQETWSVLEELRRLGAEDWFLLGDKDIALHLLRRTFLDQGQRLTEIVAELAKRLGVATTILPVTDDRQRTVLETDEGTLAFQEYFVKLRCAPRVHAIKYEGAETAKINPQLSAALADKSLRGVILCPSNPYLSIAPMLAVQGVRESLRSTDVPVVAVSPIVGGQALKGPAAKIMQELGKVPSADVIAEEYADFIDAVIVDNCDAAQVISDPRLHATSTVMQSVDDRLRLAGFCVQLIDDLRVRKGKR